jgi:deoxyribodipyrimidine photo-lyase
MGRILERRTKVETMLAPDSRIIRLNQAPVDLNGDYVLYWMTAARRTTYNYGLEHAVAKARELGKGLVVLEALRCDYPHASRRLHAFIIQGVADNFKALSKKSVLYYPYLEPKPEAGKGLLAAWTARASLVVCDWFPCFFVPRMLAAAAKKISVRSEAVDSCGLIPLSAPGKVFTRAYDFRRWLQKNLPELLAEVPIVDPTKNFSAPRPKAPNDIIQRWPQADGEKLVSGKALAAIKLPQGPEPVEIRGGARAAQKALRRFLKKSLAGYAEARNQPEPGATSGLSPYLHFGHISAQQVFWELADAEVWTPQHLSEQSKGQREGWWGMSPAAEAFLDQLVTWRELGFNFCQNRDDYDQYGSLPDWAKNTLQAHAGDEKPYQYSLEQLESAHSHDEVWNAAQRQLLREGMIAGYLRMLWGKKILEWSPTPAAALTAMIQLNDRYALDGRDPNSYSGIFWCLGRYDRAFGPERTIFGKVRYMSSANTKRKLRLAGYLERFGQDQ